MPSVVSRSASVSCTGRAGTHLDPGPAGLTTDQGLTSIASLVYGLASCRFHYLLLLTLYATCCSTYILRSTHVMTDYEKSDYETSECS